MKALTKKKFLTYNQFRSAKRLRNLAPRFGVDRPQRRSFINSTTKGNIIMALIPKAVPATAPAFENPDAGTAAVATPAPAAAATPTPVTAVATRPAGAVVVASTAVNPFADMKNAYTVDYNTLTQLIATNGNFLTKEDSTVLGDTITLQLMSFQDNWVISPGDDSDAAKKLVRYSNDGINTKDGEDIASYIADLKAAGYNKAYLSKRVVLVGALLNAGKAPQLVETLVQLDLAPTSRTLWERHTIQSAFNVGRGKVTKEQASKIQLTAKVTKNSASQIYTQVAFACVG